MTAVRDDVLAALAEYALPGAATLTDALSELWASEGGGDCAVRLHRLNSRVFRLETERYGEPRTLILKRYDPALARRNALVARRWLPALALQELAPQLDRKSTRLNSSHIQKSRMPSSA